MANSASTSSGMSDASTSANSTASIKPTIGEHRTSGRRASRHPMKTALHGKVGYQRVETNAQGRTLRVLERHDPVPGRNLFLTMDAKLQRTAEIGPRRREWSYRCPRSGHWSSARNGEQPRDSTPTSSSMGIDVETYRSLQRSPRPSPVSIVRSMDSIRRGPRSNRSWGWRAWSAASATHEGKSWCPGWFRLPGGKRKVP